MLTIEPPTTPTERDACAYPTGPSQYVRRCRSEEAASHPSRSAVRGSGRVGMSAALARPRPLGGRGWGGWAVRGWPPARGVLGSALEREPWLHNAKHSLSTHHCHLTGRLQGRDPARHKRGLHLADRIIDGDAVAFVEQLDGVDLAGRRRALLVGERQGDVKGQHLVGIPGERQLLEAGDPIAAI
jgi:hypothetical protein